VGTHQKNVPDYIEKQVGEWQVLSKMEGSSSVVVQVKPGQKAKTEGFISVSDLSAKTNISEYGSSFPRIAESDLISSTDSVDDGRLATTLIIRNNYSVDDNSQYYRSHMDVQGWTFLRGGIQSNVSMLHFAKSDQQCEIAISKADDGKTVIFANIVRINKDD
jgi:hypothetical protein